MGGPAAAPAAGLGGGRGAVRGQAVRVGIVALVIAATEINVITGSGPGAVPLDLRAYLLGALLAVPILFRHRYPFQVMLACAALIFFCYISPAGTSRPPRCFSRGLRALQRRDRPQARGQPAHREDSRQPGDDQAERPRPRAAGSSGLRARPDAILGAFALAALVALAEGASHRAAW